MEFLFGPIDWQNKMNSLLSVTGTFYVILNSRKDKDKALKEHILKDHVTLRQEWQK